MNDNNDFQNIKAHYLLGGLQLESGHEKTLMYGNEIKERKEENTPYLYSSDVAVVGKGCREDEVLKVHVSNDELVWSFYLNRLYDLRNVSFKYGIP